MNDPYRFKENNCVIEASSLEIYVKENKIKEKEENKIKEKEEKVENEI